MCKDVEHERERISSKLRLGGSFKEKGKGPREEKRWNKDVQKERRQADADAGTQFA